MIELFHGGPSGHSASVLIALAEKGLPYESRSIDLAAFEQHGEAFLAVNPAGQVPVLREDGRTLTETFFILLYLDERYPAFPLGGADPRTRYNVQKWGKYVETHIAPNLALVAWAAAGGTLDTPAEERLAQLTPERAALWRRAADGFADHEVIAARAALEKAAGRAAEDLADGGSWLAGADYSLADIAVFPHFACLASLGIGVSASVADWLARMRARPSVEATVGATIISASATMGPERGRWG